MPPLNGGDDTVRVLRNHHTIMISLGQPHLKLLIEVHYRTVVIMNGPLPSATETRTTQYPLDRLMVFSLSRQELEKVIPKYYDMSVLSKNKTNELYEKMENRLTLPIRWDSLIVEAIISKVMDIDTRKSSNSPRDYNSAQDVQAKEKIVNKMLSRTFAKLKVDEMVAKYQILRYALLDPDLNPIGCCHSYKTAFANSICNSYSAEVAETCKRMVESALDRQDDRNIFHHESKLVSDLLEDILAKIDDGEIGEGYQALKLIFSSQPLKDHNLECEKKRSKLKEEREAKQNQEPAIPKEKKKKKQFLGDKRPENFDEINFDGTVYSISNLATDLEIDSKNVKKLKVEEHISGDYLQSELSSKLEALIQSSTSISAWSGEDNSIDFSKLTKDQYPSLMDFCESNGYKFPKGYDPTGLKSLMTSDLETIKTTPFALNSFAPQAKFNSTFIPFSIELFVSIIVNSGIDMSLGLTDKHKILRYISKILPNLEKEIGHPLESGYPLDRFKFFDKEIEILKASHLASFPSSSDVTISPSSSSDVTTSPSSLSDVTISPSSSSDTTTSPSSSSDTTTSPSSSSKKKRGRTRSEIVDIKLEKFPDFKDFKLEDLNRQLELRDIESPNIDTQVQEEENIKRLKLVLWQDMKTLTTANPVKLAF
ncbi:hypothetical protein DFA_05061 [Cavenderia fasciculata]|uniref:Uncharacterized protein n=1 Tax=Cavenderia fasciculata TaxID=261658 RepID=F4PN78_CACFS|nr:uncharacterized protein DFA_05061 [Cavenderia fasciculata]EGG22931.1 hypothetical protein DFA_05061 [Cavenderia fasciculata]|eukprot:XP_004360782.1 hypothetical protein DFA_05061 [Cavenderia fasciculata]